MTKPINNNTSAVVEKVGQKTSKNGLMPNDEHILLPLQFHNDRLQAGHKVFIRFSSRVAILKLVGISGGKILWKLLVDLFVRHFLADALKIGQ